MFERADLTSTVQRMLATATPPIPPEKRGAFVVVAQDGVIHAVIAARVAGDWQIKASFEHSKEEGVAYAVGVTGTF